MGSPFKLLYQYCQQAFADSTIQTKRSVPERHLTADSEGFRLICRRFWRHSQRGTGGIECYREQLRKVCRRQREFPLSPLLTPFK
ncbi:hypothetical protein DUA64_25950 [Salmonella enterica subsp. enterica serovar Abony]|nr:hypothetical protein [Salmonella enterica subsp. enterica serovar Abony]